jgi:hypothetical protein
LLWRILSGSSDANIDFAALVQLLLRLGFKLRDDIPEILNLQARDGKAKPYQVKQVRHIITQHGLAGGWQ